MPARLLDGRGLARRSNAALREHIRAMPRPPGVAVVLVGTDPASLVYVRRKARVAERLGIAHRQIDLDASASREALTEVIGALNVDPAIDGILVQSPLPAHLDESAIVDLVDPAKDVDGFTSVNKGLLSQGRPGLVPCTPLGVTRLLEDAQIELCGLSACVVGRSDIVGRPMAMLLEHAHCTVTVCHSRTRDLESEVRRADVVVAAVGRPELIRGEWVREGAVVIDVGMNRLDDDTLVGDVEFEAAARRASAITPVPGGVGPMTIAMLMENTWRAASVRIGRSRRG